MENLESNKSIISTIKLDEGFEDIITIEETQVFRHVGDVTQNDDD